MYARCHTSGRPMCGYPSSSCPVRSLLILVYLDVISLPLWATQHFEHVGRQLSLKSSSLLNVLLCRLFDRKCYKHTNGIACMHYLIQYWPASVRNMMNRQH